MTPDEPASDDGDGALEQGELPALILVAATVVAGVLAATAFVLSSALLAVGALLTVAVIAAVATAVVRSRGR